MLLAGENLQLGEHLTSEAILGKHTLDGVLHYEIRTAFLHLSNAQVLFATDVAAIEHVLLLFYLLAGQNDLVGIDNDDEIAGIDVRRVGWLVTTAQLISDLDGQTAQDLILGVDDDPIAFDGFLFGEKCFHRISRKRGKLLAPLDSLSTILRDFFARWRRRVPINDGRRG